MNIYMRYMTLIIIAFVLGCKPGDYSPEVKQLFDEVMAIHDEVMPEMGTIHKLKKQLGPLQGNDTRSDHVEELMARLDSAGVLMMDWMADFKVPGDAEEHIQIDYLINEKTRIEEISNAMKSSIESAKSYLDDDQ